MFVLWFSHPMQLPKWHIRAHLHILMNLAGEGGDTYSVGPLKRANLNHWSSEDLKTDTNPVSETLYFIFSRIPDDGQSPETSVILSIIHHSQNPLEYTYKMIRVKSPYFGYRGFPCGKGSTDHKTPHFLTNKFLSSGRLEVEATAMFYCQHMSFCKFRYNIFTYRATVSKKYVAFNLNIVYINLTIYIIACISCVCIASKSFNSPLCCHVYVSTGLPNFGYLTWLELSSIRN
jgi:hypothetical protein